MVNGVRDRLRVLLVSGEPHAGERVWRNLLKADPSVDLVHFTILQAAREARQHADQRARADPIPDAPIVRREAQRIRSRHPRPLSEPRPPPARLFREPREICRERRRAAALLRAGIRRRHQHLPHAAGRRASRAADRRSRQRRVQAGHHQGRLRPSGDARSAAGQSRSRTRRLRPNRSLSVRPTTPAPTAVPGDTAKEGVTPNWGRWFRVITAETLAGNTLMSAPQERPLLVLDRVQKGRVAQLLSDQIWLWARGYENGGPQAELLRRLAHWLMKEPDLEEERLMAEVAGGDLRVTRQTMAEKAADVKVTSPTGKALTVPLTPDQPWPLHRQRQSRGARSLSAERRHAQHRRRGGPLEPARSRGHARDRRNSSPLCGCDRRRHPMDLRRRPRSAPRRSRRHRRRATAGSASSAAAPIASRKSTPRNCCRRGLRWSWCSAPFSSPGAASRTKRTSKAKI